MEHRAVVNAVDPYVTAEYEDGPWASTSTHTDNDPGGEVLWLPGFEVSDAAEDKLPMPINVVPIEQGFVVDGNLAFTDAFDLADWLLEWLGFDDEPEVLSPEWWDYDRAWRSHEHRKALDVAEAAQAYVEAGGQSVKEEVLAYEKLVEAVNKWRGIEGG